MALEKQKLQTAFFYFLKLFLWFSSMDSLPSMYWGMTIL